MKIHVPSMLAIGVENKHNKQTSTTMAYKNHVTKGLENIRAATLA